MNTVNVLFAGFGGQGILFSGKCLAYSGLLQDRQVSWLPSYGPEMRGGTASCSVIVSTEPVGSPIVSKPNVLIAMNLPSLDRYENDVVEGGLIIYDSSLISREVKSSNAKVFAIPATQLATENGMDGLANMIILGKMIKETGVLTLDEIKQGMVKVVSAKHQDKLALNNKAVELGFNY